jgi:hypothetical protein
VPGKKKLHFYQKIQQKRGKKNALNFFYVPEKKKKKKKKKNTFIKKFEFFDIQRRSPA